MVYTVDRVNTVDTVGTVDTVDNVDTTVDTVDTIDTVDTVNTEEFVSWMDGWIPYNYLIMTAWVIRIWKIQHITSMGA